MAGRTPPHREARNSRCARCKTSRASSPKKRSQAARQRNPVQTQNMRLNDFATLGAARGCALYFAMQTQQKAVVRGDFNRFCSRKTVEIPSKAGGRPMSLGTRAGLSQQTKTGLRPAGPLLRPRKPQQKPLWGRRGGAPIGRLIGRPGEKNGQRQPQQNTLWACRAPLGRESPNKNPPKAKPPRLFSSKSLGGACILNTVHQSVLSSSSKALTISSGASPERARPSGVNNATVSFNSFSPAESLAAANASRRIRIFSAC